MLEKIRRTGFLYSIGIVVNRIVPSWLFRFRHFVVYEMDPQRLASVEDVRKNHTDSLINISWCETEQDVRTAEKLTYTSAAEVGDDFKIAQAKSDQQTAGALWAVRNSFTEDELGIKFDLRSKQIWLFAALIDSRFRRQGIYAQVLSFMCCEGESKFARQASDSPQFLLCVNPHNIATNRVHQKYAKEVLGQAFSFKFFNVAACFCFGKKLSADSILTTNAANRPISIRIGSL